MKKVIYFCFVATIVFGLPIGKGVYAQTVPESSQNNSKKEKAKEVILYNFDATEKFIRQANDFLKQGEVDRAIEYYEAAIEVAQYDFRPYFLLARLYMQLERDDEFFKILERATRTQTHNDLIFRYLEQFRQGLVEKKEAPKVLPRISIAQFKDDKQAAICFLFDDGSKIVYSKVIPTFEEFGFKATIPVNPGFVPKISDDTLPASWDELRDADRRGFEIANHTMEHRHLDGLSSQRLEREVNTSYELIAKNIGKPPLSFAFPFDYANPRIMKKVAELHLAIRDHDYLLKVYDHVFIPVYGGEYFSVETAQKIIDLAIQKRLWLIIEGHTLKTDTHTFKPITEEFLHAHLSYIKQHGDKVWVDTFINTYLYLAEKKATQIQVKNDKSNSIVFSLVNSLDPNIYSFPLTVIINTSPSKPKRVWATQGKKAQKLDVKIDEGKLYVSVIPNGDEVHVKWK